MRLGLLTSPTCPPGQSYTLTAYGMQCVADSSAPSQSAPVQTTAAVLSAPNCSGYQCLANEHVEVVGGHCVCAPNPGYQTQAGPQTGPTSFAPPPPPNSYGKTAATNLIDMTGRTISPDLAVVANDTGINKWWIAAAALGLAAAVVVYAGRK